MFTQVQGPSGPGGSFGKAWKDPSGKIWSAYIGDYSNNAIQPDRQGAAGQFGVIVDSPATEACAKIGGTLPTNQKYEKLASYFDRDSNNQLTNQGRQDLWALFPDMETDSFHGSHNRHFWTSSVIDLNDSEFSDGVFQFNTDSGWIESIDFNRIDRHEVRCIAN